ncbi:protein translocase subunit SecD [Thermodesulfobacteriota bacterium]
MIKSLRWRVVTIVVVMLLSFIYLMPTLFGDALPEWTKHITKGKLRVGLDLQGGAHFLLGVESEKAIENAADRVIEDLEDSLREKRVRFLDISREKDSSTIIAELRDEKDDEKFQQILADGGGFSDVKLFNGKTVRENGRIKYTLDFTEDRKIFIKKNSIDQAVETIRNRIDQFGVAEATVLKHGAEEILVQLPGLEDIQRAKALIGKTAQLKFKLVDEANSLNDAIKNGPPRGSEILTQKEVDKETGVTKKTEMLIKSKTLLTGDYLKDAMVRIDSQAGGAGVLMDLDGKGAKIFAKITEENIGKRLAIVLDNNIYSAPVIREKIPNGSASITGNFSVQEANDLVIVLKAGSLPAPIEFLEERVIGPALGKDLIAKGKYSLIVGGLLVIVFMILYYRFSGVIANSALILNVFLIFGGLAAFSATLTLPGLAGIILTIGMAVDSNVLIFERIREEKRLGKTPKASIDAGYQKAFSSIIDANITTLITGLILFQFGTGPVKGFAVTLSLGILASLFTSVFVSRVIFDYLFDRKIFNEISI